MFENTIFGLFTFLICVILFFVIYMMTEIVKTANEYRETQRNVFHKDISFWESIKYSLSETFLQ